MKMTGTTSLRVVFLVLASCVCVLAVATLDNLMCSTFSGPCVPEAPSTVVEPIVLESVSLENVPELGSELKARPVMMGRSDQHLILIEIEYRREAEFAPAS